MVGLISDIGAGSSLLPTHMFETESAVNVSERYTGAELQALVLSLLHPGYVTGGTIWYSPGRTATSTVTVAADVAYAFPFRVYRTITLSGLGIRTGTGVGGTSGILAVYNNASGRPSTLVAQGSAACSTASSNVNTSTGFSANPTLSPGVYWLASMFNGAPTMVSIHNSDQIMGSLIGSSVITDVVGSASQVAGVTGVATYAGNFNASWGAATVRTLGVPNIVFQVA